jgi:hypothetical protein
VTGQEDARQVKRSPVEHNRKGIDKLKTVFFISFALILTLFASCANQPLRLSCQYDVPSEYRTDPPDWTPPNGVSERLRYAKGYEAFWWNCIMIKSIDLKARCPFICSGTPAATSGCAAGGGNASNQVDDLLNRYSSDQVKSYLQSIAATREAREKISDYFSDGPQAERMPQRE